jgi:hypothetical protein
VYYIVKQTPKPQRDRDACIVSVKQPSVTTDWLTHLLGRAMAQVGSRWPLNAEARVRARVNPCWICGGQSGTGFSLSSSVFPCQYHSTVALQIHIIWGMRNMLT